MSTAIRPLLTDPAVGVRKSAISAAAALDDREAIPALIAAADLPESSFEAGLALAALPDIPRCKSTFTA